MNKVNNYFFQYNNNTPQSQYVVDLYLERESQINNHNLKEMRKWKKLVCIVGKMM